MVLSYEQAQISMFNVKIYPQLKKCDFFFLPHGGLRAQPVVRVKKRPASSDVWHLNKYLPIYLFRSGYNRTRCCQLSFGTASTSRST